MTIRGMSLFNLLSPIHSSDADAQLSVNIKDTVLMQAACFDVDADADTGIEFISIPVSTSASTSALASYCELGLKLKTEVFEKFKLFKTIVTIECGMPIMKLKTGNGGEHISTNFQAYLISKGIEHQLTAPHSPQQNGVAKRINSTLMKSARAMLSHTNLPNKFLAEATATAAYLRNCIATSANEEHRTSFEN